MDKDLLVLSDDNEFALSKKNKNQEKDVKYLFPYLKKVKYKALASLFLFLISLATSLLAPKTVGWLIDNTFKNRELFFKFFIIFLTVSLLKIILDACQKYLFIRMSEDILYAIRVDLMDILNRLPMRFFDINSSGKIISRTVNDVTNFSMMFSVNFYKTFTDIAILLGACVLVTFISPMIGIYLIFSVIVLFTFLFWVGEILGNKLRRFRSINSKCNSFVADTMNGIELIFSQHYRPLWSKNYSRLMRLFFLSTKKMILTWARFPLFHTCCIGISYSIVIVIAYNDFQKSSISIGDFVAILSYMGLILFPFNDISARLNEFQTSMSSLYKIKDILSLNKSTEIDNENLKTYSKEYFLTNSIEFKNLSFAYNADTPIFKNLDLLFPKEKITAIIGKTGSGKSSLMSLICKLYPWQEGDVRIGGTSLNEISKSNLYDNIGIVTQQLFLFEDSLRENLRLYNKEISDKQILSVLREINLYSRFASLNKGLDTIIAKDSEVFSMGEKQLIVIARMLLKNPSILIFDEATASLDNNSEYIVQKALIRLFKDRTTIIIAHRLSTIQLANNIVVLEKGKVVEQGEPQKLLSINGAYAKYVAYLDQRIG